MRDGGPADLYGRLKRGEKAAWSELYRLVSARVEALGRKYGLDSFDCADVLQDALIVAFRNIGAVENPDVVLSWFMAIVRRMFLDVLRRRGRLTSLSPGFLDDLLVDDSRSPEDILLFKQRLFLVIEELDNEERMDKRMLIEKMLDALLNAVSERKAAATAVGGEGAVRVRTVREWFFALKRYFSGIDGND